MELMEHKQKGECALLTRKHSHTLGLTRYRCIKSWAQGKRKTQQTVAWAWQKAKARMINRKNYHHKQKPALLKRGHPFYVLQIKCLGLWSGDDRRWNDKVGPWDIPSQREACSWRCGDTAAVQRESGDMWVAITLLHRRLPPHPHQHTHTHTRKPALIRARRREPLSLFRHPSVQQYLWRLAHLWHPPCSWSFTFKHLRGSLCCRCKNKPKKKKKVGRTTKKVSSRTRARGSVCQTQAFTVFRLFCRGTTLTSSSLFCII